MWDGSEETRGRVHVVFTRALREVCHFDGMRAAASYFRQKADLCRELAAALLSQDDPVVLKLRAMAMRLTRTHASSNDGSPEKRRKRMSPAVPAPLTDLPHRRLARSVRSRNRYVSGGARMAEVRKQMLAVAG